MWKGTNMQKTCTARDVKGSGVGMGVTHPSMEGMEGNPPEKCTLTCQKRKKMTKKNPGQCGLTYGFECFLPQ